MDVRTKPRRFIPLIAFTLFLGIAELAGAMPRIWISVPPPAPIVEVRPAAPSARHVWVDGYHRWDGHAYVWTPGGWRARPRGRSTWVAGHYVHGGRGWYWVGGRWR
jgi:hypothetical protein